jgi:hypothetical protein
MKASKLNVCGRPGRAAAVLAAVSLLLCALGPLAGQASAAAAPTATTGSATAITYATAILYASVNAGGESTTYGFEYGKTTSYGTKTSMQPAGNGTITVTVSQSISGLAPGTVYHYRVVATNPSGPAYGKDQTFTTAKIPLAVQLAGAPNPVIFGNPFFVEGNLSGTGAGNREIVLQANPYPYTQGFKTVGNPEVTTSSGSFSFPYVGLFLNTQLRVTTVTGSPSVTSPTLLENVAVRVSLHIHRARRRGYYKVYGTVSPAEVGALVGFDQLKQGNRYVVVNGTVVHAGNSTVSVFSRIVRLKRHTLYRAFIEVFDPAHVSVESSSVRSP